MFFQNFYSTILPLLQFFYSFIPFYYPFLKIQFETRNGVTTEKYDFKQTKLTTGLLLKSKSRGLRYGETVQRDYFQPKGMSRFIFLLASIFLSDQKSCSAENTKMIHSGYRVKRHELWSLRHRSTLGHQSRGPTKKEGLLIMVRSQKGSLQNCLRVLPIRKL